MLFLNLISFNIINTSNRFVYTVMDFLYRLCEPSLRLVRKYVPNFGNIDISPIIVSVSYTHLTLPTNREV